MLRAEFGGVLVREGVVAVDACGVTVDAYGVTVDECGVAVRLAVVACEAWRAALCEPIVPVVRGEAAGASAVATIG